MTSFGEAFKNARKQQLKKFLWNGNWYTTEMRDKKKSPTVARADKRDTKDKVSVGNKLKNRYFIKNVNGNLYAIYDRELNMPASKAFNSLEEAEKFGNSDKFKNSYTGEITVTGARTKINKNTPGYIPVEGTFLDKNGNTRVHKNYETGLYVVTDNYGNIIGDSYDPNAANKDFNGWAINTGSVLDIKRAGSGQTRLRANMNEVNQLSKQERDRILDDRERLLAGIRGMQGLFNSVMGATNILNHGIVGGLKTAIDPNYSMQDWGKGFTIDGLYRGELVVGLGDLLNTENPYKRMALNTLNPMTFLNSGLKLNRTRGSMKIEYPNHNATASPYTEQYKAADPTILNFREVPTGKYVGRVSGKGKVLPVSGNKSNGYTNLGKNKGQVTKGNNFLSTKEVRSEYPGVTVTEEKFATTLDPSTTTSVIEGPTIYYPTMRPTLYNAFFKYNPKIENSYPTRDIPTAQFYYDGANNETVRKRILTGDFVKGTTSPNWKGGINGGYVDVYGTNNHFSPNLGGITSGGGSDNLNTNFYLPLSRKKGGQLKLIPKKWKR